MVQFKKPKKKRKVRKKLKVDDLLPLEKEASKNHSSRRYNFIVIENLQILNNLIFLPATEIMAVEVSSKKRMLLWM